MSVALIVIAGGKRAHLIDEQIIPSVEGQFDDVLVVGEHHDGPGYRYLHVPDLTKTTTDALVKRDIGTLATNCDWVFYLSDDHKFSPDPEWRDEYEGFPHWDIGVPARICHHNGDLIILNSGLSGDDPNAPYCGGHGGIFRRSLIQQRPWTTMPHDRLWDLLSTRIQVGMGARLCGLTLTRIEDIEPGAQPWL